MVIHSAGSERASITYSVIRLSEMLMAPAWLSPETVARVRLVTGDWAFEVARCEPAYQDGLNERGGLAVRRRVARLRTCRETALRAFDAARRKQGFRSQAHLDAFFRAHDHARGCSECSRVGGYFELDDGMQPYMGRCDEGRRLDAASWSAHF